MRGAWSPVLTARLKELKPGLEMDGADLPGDAEERAVALRLQELFVLTPAARAARRREIIAEFSAKSSHWQLVVKQVGQKFPALATLDPELFRHCGRDRLGRHFSGPNPQPNDGRLGLSTWLGSLIVIGFVLFLVSLFDNPSKQRQPKPWHQERKRIFQELFKLQDQKVGVPKDGGNAPNNRDRDRLP